jgi:hypothetical protein
VIAVWEPGLAKVHFRLETVDTCGRRLGVEPPLHRPLSSGDVLPILLEKGYYPTNVGGGSAYSRSALNQMLPVPDVEERMFADGYLNILVPFFGRVSSI